MLYFNFKLFSTKADKVPLSRKIIRPLKKENYLASIKALLSHSFFCKFKFGKIHNSTLLVQYSLCSFNLSEHCVSPMYEGNKDLDPLSPFYENSEISNTESLLLSFLRHLFELRSAKSLYKVKKMFFYIREFNEKVFLDHFLSFDFIKYGYTLDYFRVDGVCFRIEIKYKDQVVFLRDPDLIFSASNTQFRSNFDSSLEYLNLLNDLLTLESQIIAILIPNTFNLNLSALADLCAEDSSKYLSLYQAYLEKEILFLTYCYSKCFVFYIDSFKLNPLKYLTIASIALAAFRMHWYDVDQTPLEVVYRSKEEYLREAYRGGICDVYKPVLTDGYGYDVNSLYPYILKSQEFPIGIGEIIDFKPVSDGPDPHSDFNFLDFFGFAEVIVIAPVDLHIPFLCVTDAERGLVSPLGEWRGVYFSEEIKYALTLGYKFRFISGIKYKRGRPFIKFVNDVYKLRLKHESCSVYNASIKLILNSLGGKLGANIYHDLEDEDCFVEAKVNNTSLQIAVAMTAYSRIHMYKFLHKYKKNVYYTDTDSLYLDVSLNSKFVDNHRLGAFKELPRIKKGYFLAPKCYLIIDSKNKETMKCKGIDSLEIDKELFKNYVMYHKIDSPFFFIKKDSLPEEEYVLSGALNKRDRVYCEKTGFWVNTKPLIVS